MDRASVLFQQIEERVIEVAWMWAEVQALVQQQEQNSMDDVKSDIYAEVTIRAIKDGKVWTGAVSDATELTQSQYHAMESAVVTALLALGDQGIKVNKK